MSHYDEYINANETSEQFPAIGSCEIIIQGLTTGVVKLQYLVPKTPTMTSPQWEDFPGMIFVSDVYKTIYLSSQGTYFRFAGVGNNSNVYVRFRESSIAPVVTYNIDDSAGLYISEGWDDLRTGLAGKTLNSTVGTVSNNFTNNSVTFEPSGVVTNDNDVVNFNLQYPHGCKQDGTMNLHIHWEQPNATQRIFTLQYRIQKNGQPKTTLWTTINANSLTDSRFAYVSGTLNQITYFAPISMLSAGLSATVQFRLTRSDANSGNIEASFIDAHVYYTSLGTPSENYYT